ncbi:endo alpha-1,4 polygalactosaminidase [Pontibacillus salicampi]|uniref:Endo alpha-1,4 polygalactosaminidase n=1 Tax=Pontibacillus salicampi TaxID=1449801 RepID=A0ABV6LQF7_9BACI
MKWIYIKSGFLCVLLISFLPIPSSVSLADSNPLSTVANYKIYYDSPTTQILLEMKEYDLVIIEPTLYSGEQIDSIQQSGTKVYGYINTMEADVWNTEITKKLQPDDYFYRANKRVYYEKWDSYLMDLTSSHYRSILLQHIKSHIVQKGLDGVFLDTVGNIDTEHSSTPDIWKDQVDGMLSLLKQIKEQHPNLSLIQNFGLETFQKHTHFYMDAIMWEDFHYSVVSKDQWSNNQIASLQSLQQNNHYVVLTVSFSEKKKSSNYAARHKFIHFHTSNGFNKW